ncbi:hypothetical protein ACHAWU_008103 [Discostella pseudostelligera]|uniref:Uncharacterized protein n=1 Tax=Discostella pseudostelligera TaxID=259834 RepID=A0ABD3N7R5_9STRA
MQQLVPLSPPSSSSSPSPHNRLRLFRFLTLTSLLLSDGTYTILRRYSRGVLHETYAVNDVLLVAELIKLVFSIYMMSRSKGNVDVHEHDADEEDGKDSLLDSSKSGTQRTNSSSNNNSKSTVITINYLMDLLLRSKKMLVLAVIYGVGNVLSYYALAQIGAGMFAVIANLKTLTTAGFSVGMLGRTYSSTKWRALILLVVGVVLFVLPTLDVDVDVDNDEEENGTGHDGGDNIDVATKDRRLLGNIEVLGDEEYVEEDKNDYDYDDGTMIEESLGHFASNKSGVGLGVILVLIVVTLSGYASIYFEKVIKSDPFTIWERNFQLGFYSILIYMTLIFFVNEKPYSNWTPMASILSVLGATGGLLVALSIKYVYRQIPWITSDNVIGK